MKAGTPGVQHERLASMAGSDDVRIRSWSDPDSPAVEESGSGHTQEDPEWSRPGRGVPGTMWGIPFAGHGLNGFDNVTGEHWATWSDSMSTGITVSTGSCDDSMTRTFTGSWNDSLKKAPVTARMMTRWTSPATEIFEMYGPGEDVSEVKMMEITYTKR